MQKSTGNASYWKFWLEPDLQMEDDKVDEKGIHNVK
jgi:hypothetical protein